MIMIEDWEGPLDISTSYCPQDTFLKDYFETLGNGFIPGGDYNSKLRWGSIITTNKGRELLKTIISNYLFAGELTLALAYD